LEFEGVPARPGDGEELVVATPERVSFRLETAGLGSRFTAQLIDSLALSAILIALGFASLGLGLLLGNGGLAALVFFMLGFRAFWAYWVLPEALWAGKSLGKLALQLRVVDVRGGPVTVGQAIVRNLFRIVDFLPVYYAAGAIAIFISSRNQRLGDMVAGTIVVRDRAAVRLADLRAQPVAAGADPARPSAGPRHRLEPALRRFVVAYAQRRQFLPPAHREALARQVEPALRNVLPEVVAAGGPLAALDQLADEQL
jgi:uncharacterized RDD family membrane protein YckC